MSNKLWNNGFMAPRMAAAESRHSGATDRPGACGYCGKLNVKPEHVAQCAREREKMDAMRMGKRSGAKRK